MVAISVALSFVATLAFLGFVLWLKRQDQGKALAAFVARLEALEQRKPEGVVDREARALAETCLRRLGIVAGFARIDLEAMEKGS